jgi:hypothetical protein
MRDEFARDSLHRQFNNLRWSIKAVIWIGPELQTNCKPDFLLWIEPSMNTAGASPFVG